VQVTRRIRAARIPADRHEAGKVTSGGHFSFFVIDALNAPSAREVQLQIRRRLPLLLALLLALLGASAVPAAAAPPNPAAGCETLAVTYQISVSHDGCSSDSTIVPPLAQRWLRDFAGPVSYPLIADGRVFVTVADNDGFGTTLYALDQATGATLWSQAISGTPWSTAAYDAGRVFVVNFDGVLRRFDPASGEPAWAVQLPGQFVFTSPPTADGGVVYTGGAGSGGTLYAVSESDGAVLWTQPVSNGDSSSPALSATDVFVSYACGLVYAFDRTSGQLRWFNDGPCSGGGGKTAVYHADRVYSRDFFGNEILDASTGSLRGTFQAGPAPAFAGKIGLFLNGSTLQATSGRRTLWTFSGDGGLVTAPIVVGSTVFVGSSSGMLYGLDLRGGRIVWSTNVGAGLSGSDDGLGGLGAGQGLLVVPAGNRLAAYGS
jgi:outer membrane protein assembly factor BamB